MIDIETILKRIEKHPTNRGARTIATREIYRDELARAHSGVVKRVQEILGKRRKRKPRTDIYTALRTRGLKFGPPTNPADRNQI